MTDEQMDARLRRAGELWRTANGTPTVVDTPARPVDLAAPALRRRLPRPGLLISAAAVAAALVAGVAVLVTSIGGGQHPSADVTGLQDTVWRLVSYGEADPRTNSTATVVYNKDGTFVADDGCEVFGGSYETDHGQLFANPRDLRHRQCTDSAGGESFGNRGLDLLTGAPTYTIDGSTLTIGTGNRAMHLQAAPELPRPTLDVPTVEGATWLLTDVVDGAGQRLAVQGTAPFVIKNHELRASDGCNVLSGEVDVTDNTLSTTKGGGLRSTAVGCAARQTNATVDGVLSVNPALSLSGATLTIGAGSLGTLTYRWQPDDVAATKPALLESRDWQLTSIAGRAVQGQIRLYVSAAAASVTFGCGAVGGNVEIGPGTLRIDGVPDAPAAGCDGDRANDSSTVDSFLSQQPALWRIEDGKLLIFGGGAQAFSLVFAPDKPIAQASAPPAVDGKSWRLSQLSTEGSGSGSGSGSSSTGVVLTVTGATFTLDTNCHNYAGTASRTADKIEFSDVRDGGGRDCHDEFADAAVRLVQHGSASWSIKAGELVLVQGNTTLTFDR